MQHIADTDAQSGSFAVGEIVGATDLPQPKVNKCLIALVGRKAVGKSMVGVSNSLFSRHFVFPLSRSRSRLQRDIEVGFEIDTCAMVDEEADNI